MADTRERARPLVLDQTKAQRAKENFLETGPPPPYLRVWMTQFINFVALGVFYKQVLYEDLFVFHFLLGCLSKICPHILLLRE